MIFKMPSIVHFAVNLVHFATTLTPLVLSVSSATDPSTVLTHGDFPGHGSCMYLIQPWQIRDEIWTNCHERGGEKKLDLKKKSGIRIVWLVEPELSILVQNWTHSDMVPALELSFYIMLKICQASYYLESRTVYIILI